MGKIKVGVIGAGFIGTVHIETLKRIKNVDVVALSENDELLAKEKAKDLDIPYYFSDYKEMLKDPEIEVIHNCTPNFLHYQVNKDIITAGKHIVSEKPLTLTVSEAEELVRLSKGKDIITAVNYVYRFFPIVQEARHMVKTGDVGKLYSLRGSYLQDWLLYETDYNWRLDEKLGGKSRAIADIGSHWCDLIQHVTGKKINKVCADIQTIIPVRKKSRGKQDTFVKANEVVDYEEIKINTEDYASVLFRLEDNTVGTFTVSQTVAGRKNQLVFDVHGSKKSLIWDQESPNQLLIGHRDKPNQLLLRDPSLLSEGVKNMVHYPGGHNEGFADAFKNFFINYYDSINNKKVECRYATFVDGLYEMKLTEAILKSSNNNSWVEIK